MEIKEKIKALKAQAYDLLVMKEKYQLGLNQVNQQIAELSQKEREETSKTKEPASGKQRKSINTKKN